MLSKRKNSKYWWYKFTDAEGNTIRESTKTTDKRKAQELADKRKALSWDETKLGHRPEYFGMMLCSNGKTNLKKEHLKMTF